MRDNKGRFVKGAPNEKKGVARNPNRRHQEIYTRLIFGEMDNNNQIKCNRCDKPAYLVHHKDYNEKNDELSNLEPLCMSCHCKEHQNWRNFKKK